MYPLHQLKYFVNDVECMHTINLCMNMGTRSDKGVPFIPFSQTLSEVLYDWIWDLVK